MGLFSSGPLGPDASEDVPAPFYNGTRLENNPVDLDAQAQAQGYDSFADMQDRAPALAQQLSFRSGGSTSGHGTNYQQAASHDALNTRRMWAIIAGSAMPYNTGGPAFAAAATPTLATSGVPIATGLGPGGTLASGSALPAGTLGAPSTAAIMGGTGPTAAQLASTGAPSLAAPTAASASSPFLSRLARIIPAVVGGLQTYNSLRTSQTAQDQLLAANQQAQTDARNMYTGTANTLASIYKGQQQQAGQIFAGQQAMYAPYTSLGSGAASLLGAGLGISNVAPGPSGPINVTPNAPSPNAPGLGVQPGVFQPSNGAPTTIPRQPGIPQVPFPGSPQAATSTNVPFAQRMSSYQNGTVKMKAPDGSIEAVPAAAVDHYKSLGATVVQ